MDKKQNPRTSLRSSGTNLRRAKVHNLSVVLEIVRTKGPISRTEISRITSLSRQTIQNIVVELEEAKLVQMEASKISGRGHPGMDVTLNAKSAYSIGLHIDKMAVRAVACDLKGGEIWSTKLMLQQPTAANAMDSMFEAISLFREQNRDEYSRLFGIGIAAPGPFGPSNISDEVTSFRELGSQDNLALLRNETGLPVILENDAAAAAVGEYIYGIGAEFNSFVFMQFGLGIGAGFILNGTRYHGFSNNAGEIGHIIAESEGHSCSCGNKGCLEQYLSLNALCRFMGISPFDSDVNKLVSERIGNADPLISEWLDMAAEKFRQVINILEVLVDSEVIIVGGTAPKSFLSQLIMRSQPLFSPLTDGKSKARRVLLGAAGANTVALGAAAASLDTHFAPSVSQLLL